MTEPRTITAGQLAQRLGGLLTGDCARIIRDVAPLETAGPDHLTWVARSDLLPRLAKSRAGVVLVPLGAPAPERVTSIQVPDPDIALITALEALAPPPETVPAGVHPAAIIAASAEVAGAHIAARVHLAEHAVVGPGTQLFPGVYVGPYSRIGRDCVLGPNVVVRAHCQLGDRVIVHANSTIGTDGFGYLQRDGRHVKIPQIGRVVIEDDVEIGANTCVDRARSGETRIGRGTKIDNLVQIAHNVQIGEACIVVSQTGISGSVTLGKHVMLAGQVGLTDHIQLGDGAIVAAKSGVSSDVPAGKVYRGIPAIDNAEFGRQAVSVRRLPKLMAEFKELVKRVAKLESATDHSK